MEGPESAEYSGILSKKKLDHGRFEDPYKSKVQVWIRKNALYIRSLGPDKFPAPGSIPEKLDLAIWKVKINPHRFSGFQIEQFLLDIRFKPCSSSNRWETERTKENFAWYIQAAVQ
jgi:hypothetical protein